MTGAFRAAALIRVFILALVKLRALTVFVLYAGLLGICAFLHTRRIGGLVLVGRFWFVLFLRFHDHLLGFGLSRQGTNAVSTERFLCPPVVGTAGFFLTLLERIFAVIRLWTVTCNQKTLPRRKTMKFQMKATVSVLALMIPLSANAADVSATFVAGERMAATTSVKDDGMTGSIKRGYHRAKNEMHETGEEIEAFFIGKDADSKVEPVTIHRSMTAHGLIGETIVNTKGEKVAVVKDIIIDKDGKATMIVVSDGGLLGIGSKVAAFNYDRVVTQKPDGKVVMSLSQDMVDHAADFSYEQKDWREAKVIPAGSVSVHSLLKGDVLDNKGRKVADIENVYFRNAAVSQIIVGFNKTLGMGGDLAALDYDDLQMVKKRKELDFKMTANQTAQFKSFKKSVAN